MPVADILPIECGEILVEPDPARVKPLCVAYVSTHKTPKQSARMALATQTLPPNTMTSVQHPVRAPQENASEFKHAIFLTPPQVYKPTAIDRLVRTYELFFEKIVAYTVCLPLTVIEKANVCGCGDPMSTEKFHAMVEGFIQGFVEGNTDFHGVVPSQTRNFVKQGLLGDALIESIAPVLNMQINQQWRNIERTYYTKSGGITGAIFELLWEHPLLTDDLKQEILYRIKCLLLGCVMQNCTNQATWSMDATKANAKTLMSWVVAKLPLGEIASALL